MSTLTLQRFGRPQAYEAIIGGLIAGVIVDAFLFATGTLSWPRSYTFIASTLVGKAALGSNAYVPLGIAIHFAISAGWGAVFGIVAQRYRAVLAHPFISGITFGIVVTIVMQLLLTAIGVSRAPQSAGQVIIGLVAHTVFFGVPIALYVNWSHLRRRT